MVLVEAKLGFYLVDIGKYIFSSPLKGFDMKSSKLFRSHQTANHFSYESLAVAHNM